MNELKIILSGAYSAIENSLDLYSLNDIQALIQNDAFDSETLIRIKPYITNRIMSEIKADNLKKFKVKGSFAGRAFMLEINALDEAECRAIFQAMLKIDSVTEQKNIIVGADTNKIMEVIKKTIKFK